MATVACITASVPKLSPAESRFDLRARGGQGRQQGAEAVGYAMRAWQGTPLQHSLGTLGTIGPCSVLADTRGYS